MASAVARLFSRFAPSLIRMATRGGRGVKVARRVGEAAKHARRAGAAIEAFREGGDLVSEVVGGGFKRRWDRLDSRYLSHAEDAAHAVGGLDAGLEQRKVSRQRQTGRITNPEHDIETRPVAGGDPAHAARRVQTRGQLESAQARYAGARSDAERRTARGHVERARAAHTRGGFEMVGAAQTRRHPREVANRRNWQLRSGPTGRHWVNVPEDRRTRRAVVSHARAPFPSHHDEGTRHAEVVGDFAQKHFAPHSEERRPRQSGRLGGVVGRRR